MTLFLFLNFLLYQCLGIGSWFLMQAIKHDLLFVCVFWLCLWLKLLTEIVVCPKKNITLILGLFLVWIFVLNFLFWRVCRFVAFVGILILGLKIAFFLQEGVEALIEEVPTKSVGGSRSSSKRSRAAEVHNLSEKVYQFLLIDVSWFQFYLWLCNFACGFFWDLLNREEGVGSMRKWRLYKI